MQLMKLPLSGMSHQQFSLQIQAIHLALMDCRGEILLLLHYSHKLVESGENYKLILSILKLHINSQPPLYIQVCTVQVFGITVSVSRVCVCVNKVTPPTISKTRLSGVAPQPNMTREKLRSPSMTMSDNLPVLNILQLFTVFMPSLIFRICLKTSR